MAEEKFWDVKRSGCDSAFRSLRDVFVGLAGGDFPRHQPTQCKEAIYSMWRDEWQGKRIFVFAGGAGSGKTEVAINFSLILDRIGKGPVDLIDLDIIKPLFRLRTVKGSLQSKGIRVVCPDREYAHADCPCLPPQIETCLRSPRGVTVVDLGGDDVGARVLGRYRDAWQDEWPVLFFVVNMRRPFSESPQECRRILEEVERICGLKVTGFVHNTHLLWETAEETIKAGSERLRIISDLLRIPILFHCVKRGLICGDSSLIHPLMEMDLYIQAPWSPQDEIEKKRLKGAERANLEIQAPDSCSSQNACVESRCRYGKGNH